MSKVTKQSKIAVLKTAKANIKAGRDRFVCLAMDNCDYFNFSTVVYMQDYIRKMLEGNCVLEDWIGYYHIGDSYTGTLDSEKMRITRLAWIDWMIANAT